jgi:hypothetical protein
MEFDYVSNSSNPTRTLATTKDTTEAALTSDASTWNNDSNLTKFKLSKTVTTSQASLVPIRVYVDKYVSTSYVLVDPLINVTHHASASLTDVVTITATGTVSP